MFPVAPPLVGSIHNEYREAMDRWRGLYNTYSIREWNLDVEGEEMIRREEKPIGIICNEPHGSKR